MTHTSPRNPYEAISLRQAKTVMVMDDDRDILHLNARVLRREGYQVVVLSSPFEALELFATYTGPVDLLISDIEMPDMAGPEVVARLQRIRADLKILYVSGGSREAEHCHNHGGIPFLRKPYSIDVLVRKVRELLS